MRSESLMRGAAQCVMCGLCLPHCPTYGVTRNEGDSPRGRVSLIAALAAGQLAPDRVLTAHLEQCLHCLRCERACPANVRYGELIDGAKTLLRKDRALAPPPAWLAALIASAALRRTAAVLITAYQRSGLQTLMRRSRILNALGLAEFDAMPAPPEPLRPGTWLRQTRKRQFGGAALSSEKALLFTGCVGALADAPALTAARQLLEAAGLTVQTPARQGCCGAIHQHLGDPERAQRCMQHNQQMFAGDAPIVSCATGCGAHWRRCGGASAARHRDVHELLLDHADTLRFRPLHQTVALHTPCTLCEASARTDAPRRLLERIPGLNLVELPDRTGCCGAAGIQVLRGRVVGERLLRDKIDALEQSGAHLLLTPNVGCAMHFRRALARRRLPVQTMHPVVLLRRQLE